MSKCITIPKSVAVNLNLTSAVAKPKHVQVGSNTIYQPCSAFFDNRANQFHTYTSTPKSVAS